MQARIAAKHHHYIRAIITDMTHKIDRAGQFPFFFLCLDPGFQLTVRKNNVAHRRKLGESHPNGILPDLLYRVIHTYRN